MAITKVSRGLLGTGVVNNTDGGIIVSTDGYGRALLLPANENGTAEDNLHYIGSSSYRWRDIYLSGAAYLGGTAAANALDDYEEGTFEADIYSGSTNQVILNAVDAGTYVKIGRFVFITIQIYLNSVTSFTTSSTNNYINLPFVSASDTFNASGFRPMYYNGMGTINAGYLSTNTNKLYLCTSQNNILANLAGATTIGGSVRLYGDMTYMSAS
jgi:hypothetical protein